MLFKFPLHNRWGIAFVLLPLVAAVILGWLLFGTGSQGISLEMIAISLRSVLSANYFADSRPMPAPVRGLDLVTDSIGQEQQDAKRRDARVATMASNLRTPVQNVGAFTPTPTATPSPNMPQATLPPSGPFGAPTIPLATVTATPTPQQVPTRFNLDPRTPTLSPSPTGTPQQTPTDRPPERRSTPEVKPTKAEPEPKPTKADPEPRPTKAESEPKPTRTAPDPGPTKDAPDPGPTKDLPQPHQNPKK